MKMARRRKITKTEELVYPVLQQLTGGAKNGYRTQKADIDDMYATYSGAFGYLRRWSRMIGSFELRQMRDFLSVRPEYQETLEEMAKECAKAEKAINKYDELRIKFVEEIFSKILRDPNANFETEYDVMTDEEEATYFELKGNAEKIASLKDKAVGLQEKIASLPQDRASAPLRKPFKDELEEITKKLKLIGEI
jgi:hypothetical protein